MHRRYFLRAGTASFGATASGWLGPLARATAADPKRTRACILLWMSGGPSTIDLWDLKPGHPNGGPAKEIAAGTGGLRITEHLPKLAGWGERLAVVRSMSTREADHGRASSYLRTGYTPQGGIDFPAIGSLVAKELGDPAADLPAYVSVAPQRVLAPGAFGPGFLGPRFAPLLVADGGGGGGDADRLLTVQNLGHAAGVDDQRAADRLALMRELERDFTGTRPGPVVASHQAAYAAAVRMMRPETARAFDLAQEPAALRDRYGRTLFGQGCLLARRLVERGVPFVEVTLDGWDTHANNFDAVKTLCGTLDPAWATLMSDLKERGLLDSTLVVCMGEFGRTPKVNPQKGRDHFPTAWSAVLAGGSIKGGQAYGRTRADGLAVEDKPVGVPDLLATVCTALGVDPAKTNPSNVARPIRVVDTAGTPLRAVLA